MRACVRVCGWVCARALLLSLFGGLLHVSATCNGFHTQSAMTILRCATLRTEAEDQTCNLTQSQYTETRSTSPDTDPTTSGVWRGSSNYSTQFYSNARSQPESKRPREGRFNYWAIKAICPYEEHETHNNFQFR